jgi:hypothetical protein
VASRAWLPVPLPMLVSALAQRWIAAYCRYVPLQAQRGPG